MKLITLNIWGGFVTAPLLKFIREQSHIDIFCFQEVYHKAPQKISDDDKNVALNIFSELQALLPTHTGFFRPVVAGCYGLALFVKREVGVLEEGALLIHENPHYSGHGPTHSRYLQWVKCPDHYVVNVHGLWTGCGKGDTPERLAQSQRIKDFLATIESPKILCGDFNLHPETQSLKLIEEEMKNLVRDFKVTSTRTSLYTKPERFADYVFTSPGIEVNHFEVLKDEVSDHAPLLLDFRLP